MAGWLSAAHIGRSQISASPAALEGFCCVSHSPSVSHPVAQLHSQLISKYASPGCSESNSVTCMPMLSGSAWLQWNIMQILSRFAFQTKVCSFWVFEVPIFREIPHYSFKNAKSIAHFLRNTNLAHTEGLWTAGAQLLPLCRTRHSDISKEIKHKLL